MWTTLGCSARCVFVCIDVCEHMRTLVFMGGFYDTEREACLYNLSRLTPGRCDYFLVLPALFFFNDSAVRFQPV